MSLKEKIKPLFFALSLIIGVFVFINPVSANEVNYNAFYSTDYGFRIKSMYYDATDSNRIVMEFTLDNSSSKDWIWIENDGGINGNPQLLFGSNSSTIFNQNHGNTILFRRWKCNGAWGLTNPYNNYPAYKVLKGASILCSPIRYDAGGAGGVNTDGLTKADVEAISRPLNNPLFLKEVYSPFYNDNGGISYYGFTDTTDSNYHALNFGFTSTVEGVCGEAQGATLTTIPPDASYACASGNFINFAGGYTNELQTEIRYDWLCEGSGGGSSSACYSAIVETPINGVCGSNNGGSFSELPILNRCETGNEQGSLLQTLDGWTWSCYGYNGGSTASCSAIYSEAEAPPTIPDTSVIPTPTDCDTYSGIDKILCNFGNTIQGMFLPSTSKITELQTTLNAVGNVFPFNYLRVIGSIFSRETITQGTLTLTMWGNTETINASYWDLPIFENVRLFATVLVLLMFTFWAIGYIKHFFK
jgi:hypothetical protein